jgi:CheY-like chemotaxis protein
LVWLVAEDEADIRILITTMIQVWGHSATAYENGQKVWDWLDTAEANPAAFTPPDLVLMDIRMPGKKGNEVAARMRALPAFARTPIILMTAFTMNEAERREMIERDGVDRIIQKPLPEFEALRKLLHDSIEDKRAEAQPPEPAGDAPAKVEAAEDTAAPASPAPEAKTTGAEAAPAPTPVSADSQSKAVAPEAPAPESVEASKASVPKNL